MGKAPVKRILAVRKFTDRTEPKEAFNRIFNDAQRNTDEFNVISYYGIGGFGKTRLINEINRLLDRYNGEHSDLKKIVHVTYDFAHGTDKMYVLDKLRNLLKKQGLSFPLSDALNITYNIKCGNPVYKTVSEKDLLDDPMISIAAKFIPGASSILSTVKTGKTIMEETGKYYKKMQKIWNLDEKKLDEEISAIGKLQVNELEDQASFYFARDLCRNTENVSDDFRLPLVICLDTYEELVNSYAAYGYANAYDIWLRDDIIRTVPGVLWVIGGRERLRWDEYDDFWQGAIEEHELGDLNEADSLDFLRTAGIPEEFLQPIYKISGGTPLFLDLSVTTYYEQLAAGKTITEESFGSSREQVIERFLRYMDNDDQNVARVLAVLQSWTDDEAYAVCKEVLPVFYEECYENFIKHTIIVKDSDVRYYMHEQVRKVIADDTRKNNLRLLERTVAAKMEYYRELPWDSYENSAYVKVLEDAAVIMSRGDLSRDDFDGAYQWMADKLERVYSLSMYQTVYRMFTNIQRGLPANSEKKYIILYQLALTGIQCNHTEDVLEHLKTGMRELKEVASRRYLYLNYCLLYGLALKNLKRYEPAKEVFREVYGQAAAQSPPFTGHMATAVSNLAYIYRTLGDNDKAIEHTRWAAELRKKDDLENRIIDLYNLAQSYQNKGEREKARQYLEDAYSQAMESLGPHHIRTLTVMEALGRDHLTKGEWKEALGIYERMWQERRTMEEQN
ncbi:MAG: tetratricopeptide repeat protein, partial [Erysipelotrichaceae bacterium]|nr:tetratricopeptide repeat protein [Erysipelotrichaceae bacterium]